MTIHPRLAEARRQEAMAVRHARICLDAGEYAAAREMAERARSLAVLADVLERTKP